MKKRWKSHPRPSWQSSLIQGYTLIEIMVALTVFAILAAMTSAAMYHAFDTRARVNEQAERLNSIQLALTLLERDTTQIRNRGVYGNEMRTFPAFVGQPFYVEFTRGGIVNPNGIEQRSTLARVAYICREKQLIRRSWERLDSAQRHQYEDRVLLTDLDKCSFAYLSHNRQILHEWRENAVSQNQKPEPIPTAIQVTLNFAHADNMSLLYIIPEMLYG